MTSIFRFLFNVEQGESKQFWILFFGGIFLILGLVSLDAAALSIYFELKQNSNPVTFLLASAALSLLAIQLQLSIQNRLSFYQSLLLLIAGIGGYIFWGRLQLDDLLWKRILFVSAAPITILSIQLFWNLAARLFDPVQLRKFSLRLEMSYLVAITLLFIANHNFRMSADGLLLLSFYAYVATFLIWAYTTIDFDNVTEYTTDLLNIRAHNNFISLVKDTYKRWLIAYSLLSGVLFGLVDLFFLVLVSGQKESAVDYSGFYIGFLCITSLVGTIASLTLHRLINDRYGYRITMLIIPVFLLIVGGIFSGFLIVQGYNPANPFYLLFMLMVIIHGGILVVSKAFEVPTFRYYTLPIDQSLRSDLQTKLEAFYRVLGKLLLFIAMGFISYQFSFSFSFWAVLIPIVAIALGASAFKLHAAYRVRLKENLENEAEESRSGGNNRYFTDDLKDSIPDVSNQYIARHLSLLQTLDALKFRKVLKELLIHDDNKIQRTALKEVSAQCLLEAIPVIEEIQQSKYYPISPNKELIQRVMNRLKGAKFRLEKIKYLEQLTMSKLMRERSFGALLCSYSSDDTKPRLLGKLFMDAESEVRKNAVIASSGSLQSELIQLLIDKLGDPKYSNEAVAALSEGGEPILGPLESSFHMTGQEEKVQLKIIQIYGRVGTESAADLLLKKLNHNNQNISSAAIEALGHCKLKLTKEYELRFREELEQVCEVITWNMSVSIDLKREKSSALILNALESEIKENYDLLFKLLSLISDASSMYLVKKNITSGDPEKADFASELLDVLVAEELKPMLLPIINVGSYEEKTATMQDFFPTSPMGKRDVLYNLVQRDYKWVNRWTKACAMIELAADKNKADEELFAANLVNPDMLLRETAAIAIIKIDPELLDKFLERFQPEYNANHGNEIISKVLLRELKASGTSPALKFEIIRMLRDIPEFEEIPGIILLEISRVMELERYAAEERVDRFERADQLNYYIVSSGCVVLRSEGKNDIDFKAGSLIHPLDQFHGSIPVELKAKEESFIYKIKKEKFYELLSEHDEIPLSLLTEKAMARKFAFSEHEEKVTDTMLTE